MEQSLIYYPVKFEADETSYLLGTHTFDRQQPPQFDPGGAPYAESGQDIQNPSGTQDDAWGSVANPGLQHEGVTKEEANLCV